MKTKIRRPFLAVAGLSATLAVTAFAADQTWKTDGASDTWNTTDLNWDAGAAWTNGNAAIFTGTGETVTVATVSAAGMTFSGTGYTLASGTITHSGTITTNEDATINSAVALGANQSWSAAIGKTLTLGGVISGTSTLTYGGGGTYVIGGVNSNSGNLAISAATVKLNTGATLFCNGLGWSFRSVTISNGGTLETPNFGNGPGNLWGQCGDGAGNIALQSGGVFKMTGATMDSTVNKGIDVSASNTGYFRVPTGTSSVWNGRNTSRDFNANSGATLVFDGGGDFETARYLRGAGNVTKNDGGTLKLTDVNGFTGTLTINGGIVEAAKTTTGGYGSSIGGGSNTVVVNSGGTLKITGTRGTGYHSGAVTINGGTITMDGADLSFASGKTVTFDTAPGTINGGTSGQWRRRDANNKVAITAAASGSTISVAELNLYDNNPVFEVADGAQDADLTISSVITTGTGSGNLIKTGAGTLALSATSTYSGATTVNGGTLRINGSISSSVTVNAATLAVTGTASGAVTVNNAGTLAGSGTYSGSITSNSGSTIEGTPTFTAAVNMAGTAVIQPGGIGTVGTVTSDASLSLAGETRMDITKTGATLDCDRIAGAGAVSMAGTLTVTATGDALAVGDSFQLFTNTGGFSGSYTDIQLPALTGMSWDTSQLAVNGTITIVNYATPPTFSKATGSYVGAQSITLTSEDGATIYYTTDGSDPTLASPSGASPVVGIPIPVNATVTIRSFATKPGQGQSPEVSATYTTVPLGVWNVDEDGLWSESAKWLASAIPDGAENPVDFNTTSQGASTTVTLDSHRTVGTMTFGNANEIDWTIASSNGSILTLDNGAATPAVTVLNHTATVSAPLAGTQGLSITGPGTLVLSGANTYAGDTTVAVGTTLRLGASNVLPDGAGSGNLILGGTLDLGSAGIDYVNALTGAGPVVKSGIGTSILALGGNDTTFTYDGAISNAAGTLSLAKTGSGTLTLTGTHTYTGGTLVTGGTLELPAGSSIGTAASGRVEVAAGTLLLNGGSVTTNGTGVFLANGSPATFDFSAGSFAMNAPNQWWDVIVGQHAAATWNQTGGTADLNIGGLYVGNWEDAGGTAINLSGGVFSINGTPGQGNRRLILSVRSDAMLSVSGSAVATVPSLEYGHSPGVTPAGVTATTNLNGGTLLTNQVRNPGTRGAVFNFNGGLLKVYDMSGTLMSDLTTANIRDGGARIDTNGHDGSITQDLVHSTIGGDTSTDGGLTKTGAGILTLAGTNDYTGPTTVSEGTLRVNGALTASPSVTLAPNTSLGGSGSISGSVSAAPGTIEPGNSVGTLVTGSLDLTNGTLACEVDGSTADRLNVTGDLTLTGATLQVSEITPATFTGPVVILTYTGTLTGDFLTPTLPSGITLEHDATAKEFRLVRGGDFYSWATANSITGGPNGDSDNDGIRNLVEYALALNPAGPDGQAGSYNPATGVISFTKRQDAIDNGDITYVIQTSPDLATWTDAVTHASGNTSATISTTLTVDGQKKFARLAVSTSATAP